MQYWFTYFAINNISTHSYKFDKFDWHTCICVVKLSAPPTKYIYYEGPAKCSVTRAFSWNLYVEIIEKIYFFISYEYSDVLDNDSHFSSLCKVEHNDDQS